jgi:TrmH family RNA methyltransferase
MGSSLRMPVIIADNLVELIEKANGMGMQTLASTPRSTATDIRRISMDGGVICCVGNEGSGLTEEVISACKTAVVIPMTGRAESFNASAAAAILAWELKR